MIGIILLAASATAAAGAAAAWISRRKLRYKRKPIVDFHEIRSAARTGDILLFHKTNRSGLLDTLELDVVSPLLFLENEFRHSGIIVRKGGELFVMECADQFHSGHTEATYLTSGNGIRLVPLEPLLQAYNRDNGDPHFGIKHIAAEIELRDLNASIEQYGSVNYLKVHKSACIFLLDIFLPRSLHRKVVDAYKDEMMCSEFVHSVLNRCGVLKDYPSKLFAPYSIENRDVFEKLEVVKYSDIIRFRYSGKSSDPRTDVRAADQIAQVTAETSN